MANGCRGRDRDLGWHSDYTLAFNDGNGAHVLHLGVGVGYGYLEDLRSDSFAERDFWRGLAGAQRGDSDRIRVHAQATAGPGLLRCGLGDRRMRFALRTIRDPAGTRIALHAAC